MEREQLILRSDDGRNCCSRGPRDPPRRHTRISTWTGGSSHLGRWSYLWGHVVAESPTDQPVEPHLFNKIAEEAADFRSAAGGDLSDEANAL